MEESVGDQSNRDALTKVNITDVKNIFVGNNTTFFMKKDGSIWVTGDNFSGQYCNGNGIGSNTPIKLDLTDVKYIDSSHETTFIVKNDNSLWACGGTRYVPSYNGNETSIMVPFDTGHKVK